MSDLLAKCENKYLEIKYKQDCYYNISYKAYFLRV